MRLWPQNKRCPHTHKHSYTHTHNFPFKEQPIEREEVICGAPEHKALAHFGPLVQEIFDVTPCLETSQSNI